MQQLKLKICGMKYPENIQEISRLQPDYLGFIFWNKSKRKFELDTIPNLKGIKKVGVFVNASLEEIQNKISHFQLDAIQLHGKETVAFCNKIKHSNVEIIKAFSIDNTFDFNQLIPYEEEVDYFLFDTKGKLPGGNGTTFDWQVLTNYKLTKPFFLSGGIGLTEIDKIQDFLKTDTAQYCYAIDVNSRFEAKPGFKNATDLKKFKNILYGNEI